MSDETKEDKLRKKKNRINFIYAKANFGWQLQGQTHQNQACHRIHGRWDYQTHSFRFNVLNHTVEDYGDSDNGGRFVCRAWMVKQF